MVAFHCTSPDVWEMAKDGTVFLFQIALFSFQSIFFQLPTLDLFFYFTLLVRVPSLGEDSFIVV